MRGKGRGRSENNRRKGRTGGNVKGGEGKERREEGEKRGEV